MSESNPEVSGVVNPTPDWGIEGIITETLEYDGSRDSAHGILIALAAHRVTAEFDGTYLQVHFADHTAKVRPGDTLTVYWAMGEDD